MGDRVSISFRHGKDESVAFFSHWDGRDLVKAAQKYARALKVLADSKGEKGVIMPLDRMDPGTVMVDFIRVYTKKMKVVDSNYYLGATCNDGDNSDNGHWTIDLETGDTDE